VVAGRNWTTRRPSGPHSHSARDSLRNSSTPRASRGNLCDPSIGLYLKSLGFTVIEVEEFDEVPLPGGNRVVATPFLGEHSDLDIRAKSTYLVEIAGKKAFIGADSSGIDPALYRYIRSHLGDVDLAFLGMECDGPR